MVRCSRCRAGDDAIAIQRIRGQAVVGPCHGDARRGRRNGRDARERAARPCRALHRVAHVARSAGERELNARRALRCRGQTEHDLRAGVGDAVTTACCHERRGRDGHEHTSDAHQDQSSTLRVRLKKAAARGRAGRVKATELSSAIDDSSVTNRSRVLSGSAEFRAERRVRRDSTRERPSPASSDTASRSGSSGRSAASSC